MADTRQNNLAKESSMCEHIIAPLKQAMETIYKCEVNITHNGEDNLDKNRSGSDLTIGFAGNTVEVDAKLWDTIRKSNYKTHFIETAQYSRDRDNFVAGTEHWQPGWIYNPICDWIIDVVPLDNGYEHFAVDNFALYVCIKDINRQIVDAKYQSSDEAIAEAMKVSEQIQTGEKYLNVARNLYFDKDENGIGKIITYRKRDYMPDNYNLVVPIKQSFKFGVIHCNGETRVYKDFDTCDTDRKWLTENIFKNSQ